jgi:hypothetical protein
MELAYRLLEEGDLPGVQRLWKEEANWGALGEELWQRYVVDAPFGGMSGTVATDTKTGEIVGQFAFVPSLVSVNDRVVRAFRPGAPIVARSFRFRSPNPLNHPVVAMYKFAIKALRARGDGLIYMVPDPRWVRLFKMFPFLITGSLPLWRKTIPLSDSMPLGEGFSAAPLTNWDERVDRLWEAWKNLHGCLVVRDSKTLPWKLGDANYSVVGVERNGELVGLSASRRKDEQWLICDLLARDLNGSLRATLAATANIAHAKAPAYEADGKRVPKVTVLATPSMEPVVRDLGFERDCYDFPLVIHVLDRSLAKEDLNPSKWYVSAND